MFSPNKYNFIQAINFLFIPAWLRVTFVAVSSYIWVNVLCWIKTWPVSRRTNRQT